MDVDDFLKKSLGFERVALSGIHDTNQN